MMPGDMPCNAPCANNMCTWNLGGCCLDNEPCGAQIDGGCNKRNPAPEREDETDETSDENENENTQEN